MIPFIKKYPEQGKLRETKSTFVISRGGKSCRGVEWEWLLNGSGVSAWGDGKVLGQGSGDGCTIL